MSDNPLLKNDEDTNGVVLWEPTVLTGKVTDITWYVETAEGIVDSGRIVFEEEE